MSWWIWAIAGAALMALELTLPTGFVLISLGIGAFVAALAAAAGILPYWMDWIVFGAASIASVFAVRAAGLGTGTNGKELSDLIGELA
ncbi:MAG: NfeD family protein, partial [Candidatus Binatia bacterium]